MAWWNDDVISCANEWFIQIRFDGNRLKRWVCWSAFTNACTVNDNQRRKLCSWLYNLHRHADLIGFNFGHEQTIVCMSEEKKRKNAATSKSCQIQASVKRCVHIHSGLQFEYVCKMLFNNRCAHDEWPDFGVHLMWCVCLSVCLCVKIIISSPSP